MITSCSSYTVLYTTTRRGEHVYAIGGRYEADGLFGIYTNPSIYKRRAFDACIREFYSDRSARNFRICSHNTQRFTVAWDTAAIDPKTGELEAARVVKTGVNNYLIIDK